MRWPADFPGKHGVSTVGRVWIPRDKILHVGLGCVAVLCGALALWIYACVGAGAALAFTSTAVGAGYEAQQYIRKEGRVEMLDAVATAAPGWVVWVIMEIIK